MQVLINRVSDVFEQGSDTRVLESARYALLKPALPHLANVTRELESQNISLEFLEESVKQILDNALKAALRENLYEINSRHIEFSMKRFCPYLFWC